MFNFLKKMGKELGRQRKIDVSVEKTLKSIKSRYRVVPSMEIKAWKAYLAVTFAAGFAAALIWGSYMSVYQTSKATGPGEVTLSVSAAASSHKAGDEFPIQILLDTAEKNIVAVQVIFNYDKNTLQIINTDTSSSGFNNEVTNTIDSNQGQGFLALAKKTPGVNGVAVKVVTVNLRALADVGEPTLRLKLDTFNAVSDSAAILDDGLGTNVLRKLASLFPAAPTSSPPVQQGDFAISSKISLTDTVVRLGWSAGTVVGSNYIVERKLGKADYVKISEVGSGETSFIDRSVKTSKSYIYRICQVNNAGEKSCAPEQQIKTLGKKKIFKPRFTAINENGKVRLNWSPTYASGFNLVLQRKVGKQKAFKSFTAVSSDINTFLDENVAAGTRYIYRLVISAKGKKTQYSNNIKIVPQ
jgi:hypothetical protein